MHVLEKEYVKMFCVLLFGGSRRHGGWVLAWKEDLAAYMKNATFL